MRWLFLLLLVLNLFFFVWHQQQAPARVKEVASTEAYRSQQQAIRLLSEAPAPARREVPAAEVPAQERNVCLFLGGFDQEASALVVEQRLLSLDIQSNVQSVDAAAGVDYWVYLPPLSSRQASLRQLRELQSRNIDSYIITVGDLANGISLGIFSRRDSAEGVISRLREVDYEPQIRELPRVHRKYWVRVAAQSRHLVDDGLLANLTRDMTTLQHRQMPCESVATSE
ncbi:SPOR domain-containing protein [Stutzerimonas azotifigens]|uniref:SPOR domain-containing protein n=1 Tax=Stutzerimonas azotifigens TaxID=291995 RepID=A0ABR5Z600_9GAMM|nr:SPOR domain-containing protein [Stutzerimonas azotifigens]MBA1275645.1 SPOR domain-containing protein [Stutzerimonas azotifigens]